jgi:hypothetical protein
MIRINRLASGAVSADDEKSEEHAPAELRPEAPAVASKKKKKKHTLPATTSASSTSSSTSTTAAKPEE